MIYDLNPIRNRYFKYGIAIPMMLDFHRTRQWLSNTYGYSDTIDEENPPNEHWAFMIRLSTNMIYLKGDEELSWFKIKHGESL